jgi:hypothetical protein
MTEKSKKVLEKPENAQFFLWELKPRVQEQRVCMRVHIKMASNLSTLPQTGKRRLKVRTA